MEVFTNVSHNGEDGGSLVVKEEGLVYYGAGNQADKGGDEENPTDSKKTRIRFGSIEEHTSKAHTVTIVDNDGQTFEFKMASRENAEGVEKAIAEEISKADARKEARQQEAATTMPEPPTLVGGAEPGRDDALFSQSSRSDDMQDIRAMASQQNQKNRKDRRFARSAKPGAVAVPAPSLKNDSKKSPPKFPHEKFRGAAPRRAAPQAQTSVSSRSTTGEPPANDDIVSLAKSGAVAVPVTSPKNDSKKSPQRFPRENFCAAAPQRAAPPALTSVGARSTTDEPPDNDDIVRKLLDERAALVQQERQQAAAQAPSETTSSSNNSLLSEPPAEPDETPGAFHDPGPPIGPPFPMDSSPRIEDSEAWQDSFHDEENKPPSPDPSEDGNLTSNQDPLVEALLVPDDENRFQDEGVVLVEAERAGLSDYLQNRNLQGFIVGLLCLFAVVIIATVVAIVLAVRPNPPPNPPPFSPAPTTSVPILAPSLAPSLVPPLALSLAPSRELISSPEDPVNETASTFSPTVASLDIPTILSACNFEEVPPDSYITAGCFQDVNTLDSVELECSSDDAATECSLRCTTRFFGITGTTCRCLSEIKSERISLDGCTPVTTKDTTTDMELYINFSPVSTMCKDPIARTVRDHLLQQGSSALWGFDIVSNRWKESPFELFGEGCSTNLYGVTSLNASSGGSKRDTLVQEINRYANRRRSERAESILFSESDEGSAFNDLTSNVTAVSDTRQIDLFPVAEYGSHIFTTYAVKRLAKVEVEDFESKASFVAFSSSFRQYLVEYLNGGFQKEVAYRILDRFGQSVMARGMLGGFMELRLPLTSSLYDATFDSVVHSRSCFEIATSEEASRLGFPDNADNIDANACSPNIVRALQQLRASYRGETREPDTVGGTTECRDNTTCEFLVDVGSSRPLTENDKYPNGDLGGYQLRPLSDFLSSAKVSPLEFARMKITEERFNELQQNLADHTVEYFQEVGRVLDECSCGFYNNPPYLFDINSTQACPCPGFGTECRVTDDRYQCTIRPQYYWYDGSAVANPLLECDLDAENLFDFQSSENCVCTAEVELYYGSPAGSCGCSVCPAGSMVEFSVDCSPDMDHPFLVGNCSSVGCNGQCNGTGALLVPSPAPTLSPTYSNAPSSLGYIEPVTLEPTNGQSAAGSVIRTSAPTFGPDSPGCEGVPHALIFNKTFPTEAGSRNGDTFYEDPLGTTCLARTGFQSFNEFEGKTSEWFQANATSSTRCVGNVEHRIVLDVPDGVNYDLKVYLGTQFSLYDSSTQLDGETDTVTISEPSDYVYFVKVEYVPGSGASCSPWVLRFEHFA